jgi:hypothetical protein
MFVMTAKLSKSKLIAGGVLIVALLVLIVLLAGSGGDTPSAAPKGTTNDERVAYLATIGWSVNAEPKEAQKVKIPESAENKVFARYNDLQKSAGYDLSRYAGKTVMRYVYRITNYPGATEPVYATLLVYKDQVIGGDITDTAAGGLMQALVKRSQVPATLPETKPTQTTPVPTA